MFSENEIASRPTAATSVAAARPTAAVSTVE
jgi:hypothetical protein